MNIEVVKIDTLIPDPVNARKHPEKNLDAIKGSLAKFGQQKPIVVGKNNIVYAGNGTLAAAKALGWTEINIVRTDLEGSQATAFALADNRTAELAEWDMDLLGTTLLSLKDEGFELLDIGFDDSDLDSFSGNSNTNKEDEKDKDIYTKKIEIPIYEPKGEKPLVSELFDTSKTDSLIKEINESNIPENEKTYLRLAAQRHIVFNYEKAAEYYAHSPKEMQNLMENSALVIIDFNKAIENGFVKMVKEIVNIYNSEQQEDFENEI